MVDHNTMQMLIAADFKLAGIRNESESVMIVTIESTEK